MWRPMADAAIEVPLGPFPKVWDIAMSVRAG
jgi:hypothetical protein